MAVENDHSYIVTTSSAQAGSAHMLNIYLLYFAQCDEELTHLLVVR